eukprot:TRINITY_DN10994_c1_g1_i3.p1 TRINITY_DN10994_c1_g1~~TRINITY_DN10994_c1_g1_i3.p1  ORF type:complete len:272 (-),score=50.80 TRINITY_DN10994_c1_g1_i3:169-984(-)
MLKDSDLADRLLSGDWGSGDAAEKARERLKIVGPISARAFDESGLRNTEVALPQLGRWAKFELLERRPGQDCSDGGVTWAMAVVFANVIGMSLPEYPRLRVLELGSGTGLVSLVISGRGHDVVASEGDACALNNLRSNLGNAGGGRSKIAIRHFRWHVEEDRRSLATLGVFDIIVGSDLISEHSHCDALRGSLPHLIASSGTELLLLEKARSWSSLGCSELLRSDGWELEEIPGIGNGSGSVVIDGETNPKSLQDEASNAILVKIRLKTSV